MSPWHQTKPKLIAHIDIHISQGGLEGEKRERRGGGEGEERRGGGEERGRRGGEEGEQRRGSAYMLDIMFCAI